MRKFSPSAGVVGKASAEDLPLLDDLGHLRLKRDKILGGEGTRRVEVVVKAVLHRRPDSQRSFGEDRLHCLRKNMCGGVTQHSQALRLTGAHRLNHVTLRKWLIKVLELPVYPCHDDIFERGTLE